MPPCGRRISPTTKRRLSFCAYITTDPWTISELHARTENETCGHGVTVCWIFHERVEFRCKCVVPTDIISIFLGDEIPKMTREEITTSSHLDTKSAHAYRELVRRRRTQKKNVSATRNRSCRAKGESSGVFVKQKESNRLFPQPTRTVCRCSKNHT